MEMHQLRYFVAAADTGNFTRAARRSNISQPSLSQQIQKLEDELGKKLFDRLGRRAELTAAGRVFLDRARRILQDADDAIRAVEEEDGGGPLRLGVIPSVAPYLVPDLLPKLRAELPRTEFEVHEDFRSYLVEQVLAGRLEGAIVSMPPPMADLMIEPIVTEPLLAVMPERHPLAARKHLQPADIDGQRLVLLGESSSLALQTRRFFGDQQIQVEIVSRCAQVKTVKALVAAGLGVAILPKMAAGRDGISGLTYRELTNPQPRRELVLVRHLRRYQAATVETFRRILLAHCAERYGNPAVAGPVG